MLEDVRTPVLLMVRRGLLDRLAIPSSVLANLRLVCLDEDGPAISRHPGQNPSAATTGDHLAYVMFTSGSTGKPKGVSVVHRGVVRLVRDADYADLSDRQVYLQLAPVSFDASTLEIWAPLLNGGRLVVFAPRTPTLHELGTALDRHRVTTLTENLIAWSIGRIHPAILGKGPSGTYRGQALSGLGDDGEGQPAAVGASPVA
jgi:aspartate racemase